MIIVGPSSQQGLLLITDLSFMTSTIKSFGTTPFYTGPDVRTLDSNSQVMDGYSTCRRGSWLSLTSLDVGFAVARGGTAARVAMACCRVCCIVDVA